MSQESSKKIHKTSVGGQALIEGIMMRGPKGAAMSVRLPNGEIETELKQVKPWKEKCKILGVPIVRGVVGFVESLVTGYGFLMESAEKSTQGLETSSQEELSKVDQWIEKHFGEKIMNIVGVISAVLGIGISFFLFMWLPTFLIDLIASRESLEIFHPLFEGIVRIIIFIAYLAIVSQMKDIKRVFMYHGAEHKSIFCYENGLELTVENVKKQSRFHPRCGTSFMFVMILISILISSALFLIFPALKSVKRIIWVLIKLLILPFVMGLGYEFIKYAGKHDNVLVKVLAAPGLWMQRITTKEPTDDIIEVGIESLKAVLTENPEDDEIK